MSSPPTKSDALIAHENEKVNNRVSSRFDAGNVLLLLVAIRLLNALVLRTFFQPDEYYQALEPAWQLAFGESSGAWITWEWKERLRSAFQPAIFSVVYQAAAALARLLQLSSSARTDLLLVAPKVTQGLIAAFGDYYTWKLAERVYGKESNQALMALALTITSPWQWFCSTRTFSNSLETTLTVVAIYNWPFHWALSSDQERCNVNQYGLRIRSWGSIQQSGLDEETRLRRAVIFAVLASIIRPTNVLIWLTLALMTFVRPFSIRTNRHETISLVRNGIVCSSLILVFSTFVDRLFYGGWTFPPLNFFRFNVIQSLAVFYGNNDWHYYLSQGYPLLMMSALPFGILGLVRALQSTNEHRSVSIQSQVLLRQLAVVCLVVPTALSILAHKEVRFIYPLLPALHVIAASPLSQFVNPSKGTNPSTIHLAQMSRSRTVLFGLLISINAIIAIYTSLVHNAGLISLPEYLHSQFEHYYMMPHLSTGSGVFTDQQQNLTLAFLMPCHSVPWRSHLQYSPSELTNGISGWALTCEPPLNLSEAEKKAYLDEADIFYEDPLVWMKKNMSPQLPPAPKRKPGFFGKTDTKRLWGTVNPRDGRHETWLNEGEGSQNSRRKRSWPDYLVFFEQLEPTMRIALTDTAYRECARFFNSHFHDDWRRTGDVIVWCLYPERAQSPAANEKRWYEMFWKSKPKLLTEDEVEELLHQGDQQAQHILGARRMD